MSVNTDPSDLTPLVVVTIVSPPRPKGSSWLSSAFLVVNAALGAGLLNFPQAYHQAGGVVTAIAIQSLFLVFIVVAIFTLGYSSDMKQSTTYQDTVSAVCGSQAKHACAVSILLYCFGTCITFLIIIGDQWEEFFLFVDRDTYCDESPFYMSRWFTIVFTSCLFILPMIFPRRIDFLKYASFVGVLGIFYVVGLVTVKYFLPHPAPGPIKLNFVGVLGILYVVGLVTVKYFLPHPAPGPIKLKFVGVLGILYVVGLVTVKYFLPHPPPGAIKLKPDNWIDVFLVVPDICFAYQCHVSIIPIYSCMEKRNLKEFSKTVTLAMILCVLTYTVTAALGYLMFGDKITSDILLSFEPDIPTLIAVILIAVKTYTTYPILLFCGRAALDCLWIAFWRMTEEEVERQERRRRVLASSIWFALTLVLAVFIPNIGVVIQVLGAFAAIFIFIFPGMCLLKLMIDNEENSRKLEFTLYFASVFIVLGAFIFGLTLTQALMVDIQSNGGQADKSNFTC
ncbi:hypothetical protein ACOMHN_032160 [Nucella lapillus]